MVRTGQVGLLGGVFYEPSLTLIPVRDLVAQAHKMNELLMEEFAYYPRGFWIPERVWEPHLPTPLSQAGAADVSLDAENFWRTGPDEVALLGGLARAVT